MYIYIYQGLGFRVYIYVCIHRAYLYENDGIFNGSYPILASLGLMV